MGPDAPGKPIATIRWTLDYGDGVTHSTTASRGITIESGVPIADDKHPSYVVRDRDDGGAMSFVHLADACDAVGSILRGDVAEALEESLGGGR